MKIDYFQFRYNKLLKAALNNEIKIVWNLCSIRMYIKFTESTRTSSCQTLKNCFALSRNRYKLLFYRVKRFEFQLAYEHAAYFFDTRVIRG